MAVILITGQPGGGKTALCVDMLAHDDQFKGRPLFVMGIPELTLDHQPCPPVAEWTEMRTSPEDESINLAYFTFPEGALVVLDEAQRIYRPRSTGSKVPPEVAAFETHRHTGIDFILLTQHPGLLDSNIRKLIGRHIHIRVTPLGRYKYEWTELGDPESSSSREVAAKERYTLPARVFKLYKSSQLHTKIKTKLPWFVWVFLIALVGASILGYLAISRVKAKANGETAQTTAQTPHSPGKVHDKMSAIPPNDLQAFTPRIPGLAHTAPRYDALTTPVDAPWPTGCTIVSAWRDRKESCRCIDQQGHKYQTEESICRQIATNGIFKDWQGIQRQEATQGQAAQPTGPVSSPVPPAAQPLKS